MVVETIKARNRRIVGDEAIPMRGARLWDLAKAITGNGLDWRKLGYTGNPRALPVGVPIGIEPLLKLRRQRSGRTAGRRRSAAWLEARRRTAMRHIKDWVFNLKYAEEFSRLIYQLSDPTDEVEFRNAEKISRDWYDYTARTVRTIRDASQPVGSGLGLVGLVKVADSGPRELVEGLRHWNEGIRRAPWSPKLLRVGTIAGHAMTVFGMGLEGYLLYGNVRDRRYAKAVGNVGAVWGGALTLYEAGWGGGALLSGAKVAAASKVAALGTGSVAVPIALAVGLGLLGSWVIGKVGEGVVHRRVREGHRKVLPGLRRAYYKHKNRADQARQALDRMVSSNR